MSSLSFDPCGCSAHHDSHRPDCPALSKADPEREKGGADAIEPDEVIPASQVLPLIEPSAGPDADQSWIEQAGFEVTRPSPPVGSVAAGFPGIGFDLMVPDERGHLQLAEAYGPDGKRRDTSALTGRRVPGTLSEGEESQRKALEEVSEARAALSDEDALDEELFGGLGIVHGRSLD